MLKELQWSEAFNHQKSKSAQEAKANNFSASGIVRARGNKTDWIKDHVTKDFLVWQTGLLWEKKGNTAVNLSTALKFCCDQFAAYLIAETAADCRLLVDLQVIDISIGT